MTNENQNQNEISRVAYKPPPFWESNPELWFGQIESQFVISGITSDKTKFHSVIAALDAKILTSVVDLIRTPPTKNQYDTLKERILNQYSQSETSKLKLLLQDLQLGDKRPSQFLLEMRNLASNKIGDEILKSLWMQRLPISIQQILSVCSDPLDKLAAIADKINEVSGCVTVSEISSNSNLQSLKDEIASLRSEVKRLSRSQSKQVKNRNRRKSFSRERSISRNRSNSGLLCWYHRRFAEKANKCVKPCQYSENL